MAVTHVVISEALSLFPGRVPPTPYIRVSRAASLTDENGFGLDLRGLTQVGGREDAGEPGALPGARDAFTATVTTLRLEERKYSVTPLARAGVRVGPWVTLWLPLVAPWPRVLLRALYFQSDPRRGVGLFEIPAVQGGLAGVWVAPHPLPVPPLNDGVTLNKSLGFSKPQSLSRAKWGLKGRKKKKPPRLSTPQGAFEDQMREPL